ncbi:hypothetical protein BaRGS_00002833 [Batillaria attramentaria]|uniref:Uncharacterized protein n=1 Tax=Batillaria attramentaria TaxID=370345 RepID=A0ABD0M2X8_9CAEN
MQEAIGRKTLHAFILFFLHSQKLVCGFSGACSFTHSRSNDVFYVLISIYINHLGCPLSATAGRIMIGLLCDLRWGSYADFACCRYGDSEMGYELTDSIVWKQ